MAHECGCSASLAGAGRQNEFLQALGHGTHGNNNNNGSSSNENADEPSVLMRLGPEAVAFALKMKELAEAEAAEQEALDAYHQTAVSRSSDNAIVGSGSGSAGGGHAGGARFSVPRSRSKDEPPSLSGFLQASAFDEVRVMGMGIITSTLIKIRCAFVFGIYFHLHT
jgi:hypothetical protein